MKIAIIAAAVLAFGGATFAQTGTTSRLPAQTQGNGGGTGPTTGGIGGVGGGKFGEPGGSATASRGIGSSLVRQASPPTGRPALGPGSASAERMEPMARTHATSPSHRMMKRRPMRRHRHHAIHHTMKK